MKIQASITFVALLASSMTSMSDAFSVNSQSNNNINSIKSKSDRRSFLDTIAATTAASILTGVISTNPASALDDVTVGGRAQYGSESIMSPKAHGTSETAVQESLRYGVSTKLADRITNFNRRFAEYGGYLAGTSFEEDMRAANGPVTFYDSNSGKPLFVAPINRSVDEFIEESKYHGWPSFRDQEVVWDNVKILKSSGETVSVDGTHLGHNLPDRRGNRFCINLVSVAGNPV